MKVIRVVVLGRIVKLFPYVYNRVYKYEKMLISYRFCQNSIRSVDKSLLIYYQMTSKLSTKKSLLFIITAEISTNYCL